MKYVEDTAGNLSYIPVPTPVSISIQGTSVPAPPPLVGICTICPVVPVVVHSS